MSYKTLPTKEFEKDFTKLETHLQKRIIKKITEVSTDPTRYKHMRPPWNNHCRVRIGKLRIIFSYDTKEKELYLEKIVFKHNYSQ